MRVRRCRFPGCHAMVQLPNHYCSKHFDHEAEYLASRQKWARAHDKTYQRKYNTVTRYRNDTKSDQYRFYRSKTWVSLRKQALDRDHYRCQYCGAINAKTVDHIVPIEFDSAKRADLDNLSTICRHCHHLKTIWEENYYGTGKNSSLKDVDEIGDVKLIARLMQNSAQ